MLGLGSATAQLACHAMYGIDGAGAVKAAEPTTTSVPEVSHQARYVGAYSFVVVEHVRHARRRSMLYAFVRWRT